MEAQLLQRWPKEDGAGGSLLQQQRLQRDKTTTSIIHSNLELRLGILPDDEEGGAGGGVTGLHHGVHYPPSNSINGLVVNHSGGGGGGGAHSQRQKSVWFPEAPPPAGFVHPWSLAARQEKAAFEQSSLKPCCLPSSSSTLPRVSQPPPVVGWPPVRAYRRNITSSRSSKLDMEEEENEAKKSKPSEKGDTPMTKQGESMNPSTMFVKVNMEGYAVGRKVDLMAHDGYESLSQALKKMFENFLAVKQSNTSENDEKRHVLYPELTLLYEDIEGDRMLVGDVPWEMFVGSVKRLFITYDIKTHVTIVEGKEDKKEKEDEDAMLHS